jgi:hypothetical protein
MVDQPIPLSPEEIRVLITCPLHYHFLQQKTAVPTAETVSIDARITGAIHQLHAAGGPARLSIRKLMAPLAEYPAAQLMVEHYYLHLRQEWPRMLSSNETMQLQISVGGVILALHATLDRVDKTGDGGVLAILLRTASQTPPTPNQLRRDPALTIYHAVVASAYPQKRPVRLQELWLYHNQAVTVELSEAEFRDNLRRLREPVQALARSEVRARPGHHCEACPFKQHGCPVYAHDDGDGPPIEPTQRQWIYKI